MLKLPPRQADIKAIVKILDSEEYESAEAMARALLDRAWQLLQERARFTVVGQLRYSRQNGGYVDADDARAAKVCLGLFATESDARRAGESLAYSAATGEEFRWWLLPVEHATPAEIYAARQKAHRLAEAQAKTGRTISEEDVA